MKTQIPSLEISHFPVMLSEIIKIIAPSKGGLFVDCTFGGGSYSEAILKFPNTKVIAIDRDPAVISIAQTLKRRFKNRFELHQSKIWKLEACNRCPSSSA